MSDEDRIREAAYARWEGEGRPEGQHERHWNEASAAQRAAVETPQDVEEGIRPENLNSENDQGAA